MSLARENLYINRKYPVTCSENSLEIRLIQPLESDSNL